MAYLRNVSFIARRTPITFFQRAGLRTTAIRFAGKESALHHEGRAEEVEKEKHDQLRKQKEGKGEWKSSLASDSESIIKADRGEVDASEDTIKKLQEESAKVSKK
ncbi:hypothetical protein M501DRAFT_998389 [Patellaria atrata CBS 101060]|uniref:Mitochondrial ATPase inhibitor n=1 Tax=Patellaria atrata CBS 101060 TaxID=1346257 RepID=A0A9P4SHY1_9PEZI|nr:hypothetical protein M501DRAFT_998389 [Patellaria atrata CBS 101060]